MQSELIFFPESGGVPPSTAGSDAGRPLDDDLLATRILLVEDEVMIAWMIESLLEDMGFLHIEMVSTGAQARASAIASAPGLIVTDVNLGPGGNGIDAAVDIVAERSVPVIFITAYADDAMRGRIAGQLPEAQLLRKPIQNDMLRKAVLNALRAKVSH